MATLEEVMQTVVGLRAQIESQNQQIANQNQQIGSLNADLQTTNNNPPKDEGELHMKDMVPGTFDGKHPLTFQEWAENVMIYLVKSNDSHTPTRS